VTRARVAQVVPDLASFAVDGGFAYAVGDHPTAEVGRIVRVPLSGRPRRGYVVAVREDDVSNLKEIRGVSGARPVFDPALLATVDEMAAYYVAPRSVVLGKTAPPNLPKKITPPLLPSIPPAASIAPDLTSAATAAAGRSGHVQVLASTGWAGIIRGLITDVLVADRSVVVVLPTAAETERLGRLLRRDLGDRVLTVADDNDAETTRTWSVAAATPGMAVLGTPKVAWWPVARLAMFVLVDEGRRGMKERQTPTVAVARVVASRAVREGLQVAHLGRVPTSETLALSPPVVHGGGRLWPPVEVVDRGLEPPGSGLFAERTKDAVRQACRGGGRVFVFTHRHGYAPASRCTNCRELRLCASCGARPDVGPACARCGAALSECSGCGGKRFEPLGAGEGRVLEEARRVFGEFTSAPAAEAQAQIAVGTERDLVALGPVDLSVAVDADGLIRGTNYRAREDALALLARVASKVRSGRANRLICQTVTPDHSVLAALRRADPMVFFEPELQERAAFGMPPSGDVIVLEIAGSDDADEAIRDALDGAATVFGPASHRGVQRWLIQGPELSEAKLALREVVARQRDKGAKVRVDVDPRDL
jgi:primosomal protein N' (replication factor Y)